MYYIFIIISIVTTLNNLYMIRKKKPDEVNLRSLRNIKIYVHRTDATKRKLVVIYCTEKFKRTKEEFKIEEKQNTRKSAG